MSLAYGWISGIDGWLADSCFSVPRQFGLTSIRFQVQAAHRICKAKLASSCGEPKDTDRRQSDESTK